LKSEPRKPVSSFFANVAFSLLSLAGPLLFAFIATPFLIRGLGTEAYGYYSLVLAVIGFGFTTGIGRIAAKYIPENRASGEKDGLARLLSATILITLSSALLEALILAAASTVLVSQILNVPDTDARELRTAIYFACLIGPMMMLSQIFQSALQGIHRFRTFAALTVAASFLLNFGSIILAVNNVSYSNIFIWNLIVTTVVGAAFVAFARKQIPELKFTLSFDGTTIKKVGRFASSIFVYQTITSVFYLFERAYILRNYGAEALTYYTVPLMLGIYLHGFIFSFSQVAVPKLNERILNCRELTETYRTVTKIAVSISVFIVLMYFSVGKEFLGLWLGNDFASGSYQLLVIHGFAFAATAVSIACWILSEAAHRPGINAISSTVTSLVGISSILLLVSPYRIETVAAGRLIGAAAVIPIIFIVERIVFGSVMWRFWIEIVNRIAISCIVVLITYYSFGTGHAVSWVVFLITTVMFTGIFWAVLYLSGYFARNEIASAFAERTVKNGNSGITYRVQ
jgi:O-antigen/teichoic acid export membrane protein